MAIEDLQSKQDLANFIDELLDARPVKLTGQVPTFLSANRPATPAGPMVIYVPDGVAGSKYQGWDVAGGAWVALG